MKHLLSHSSRALGTLIVLLASPGSVLANWDAAPLTVHEWGVNTFDWEPSARLVQELPEFLYTDKKPGKQLAQPEKRVRDLQADGGTRTKPILYFFE